MPPRPSRRVSSKCLSREPTSASGGGGLAIGVPTTICGVTWSAARASGFSALGAGLFTLPACDRANLGSVASSAGVLPLPPLIESKFSIRALARERRIDQRMKTCVRSRVRVASRSSWPRGSPPPIRARRRSRRRRVCRQSALASEWKDDPAEAGTRRLRVRRDLDGDGMADRLDGVEYNGNDSSSDEVTLTLGGGRGKFSGSRGGSFEEMVSYVEVAPELASDKAEAARRIVEDALIATVCSGPEASAELVLYAPHAPRWQPGEPVMPDTYLFFSTNAEDRAHAGKHARAAWVTYLGANHARDDHARLGAGFRELEPRDGPLELRATAHGVVLI